LILQIEDLEFNYSHSIINININKLNIVQVCEHIFRDNRAIIMREYNSSQKQSDRIYAVFQRIVIRKNTKFWRLHLRDVGLSEDSLMAKIERDQLGAVR
jgi:hypothetical protein